MYNDLINIARLVYVCACVCVCVSAYVCVCQEWDMCVCNCQQLSPNVFSGPWPS